MNEFLTQIVSEPVVMNGFWVFVGIVAGALVQHFLGYLNGRRQAKNAFKVLTIEIAYNLSEVENFLKHVKWLKSRIQAGQISEEDFFLPMQKFDYSTVAPLANSGYFHLLLGPKNVRRYLEFNHFFRNENGQNLASTLQAAHRAGRSMAHLEGIETRAVELKGSLGSIGNSKLNFLRLGISEAKNKQA